VCAPGTFAEHEGMTDCTQAPMGMFVAAAASTAAEPCHKGTFAAHNGTVECEKAHKGNFV